MDSRNRVALGGLARHETYFGATDENGVITLTPVELVPVVAPQSRRRASSGEPAVEGDR